jgi:diguanylate cyclase (GGDEF)-like protein/PAS domain S-box-containing protein
MKSNKKSISIKNLTILAVVIALIISASGIAYLIFSQWFSSAEQLTEKISTEINSGIFEQAFTYMSTSADINEENHSILENGILDLTNNQLREKYFVGVLKAQDTQIYSFSYGTVYGEYYGARRNDQGILEIMRNDATTGGQSWYYAVNQDSTAGELVLKAGAFDPRTRAWYQAAVESGQTSFSPVYKHFVMDDLAISSACPIYDEHGSLLGVLGTHMLLSDIGSFLEESMKQYGGYAILYEKSSGALIANSMGQDNFKVLQDGSLERYVIEQIENTEIIHAYEQYHENVDPAFEYIGKSGNLFVNIQNFQFEGLNWVLLSALPEDLYMSSVTQSIYMTFFLVILALLIAIFVYSTVTSKLMKPLDNLVRVSVAMVAGDLSKRVKVVRNDEIGVLSNGLNQIADTMQDQINNLETNVRERTTELNDVLASLEENQAQLQLILNSTAEAIYGIDINGLCTFCNLSCLKVLGYQCPDDLIGQNMHWKIHSKYPNGSPMSLSECKIHLSVKDGLGYYAENEVFWRADGSSLSVGYHSYPQIKNGEVIGAVITFMDITGRKKKEEEIRYLNDHDVLTGLYNRKYFEEARTRIDVPENLPISIIFGDIDGLKMTNDIFGHAAGDDLLYKSANILKKVSRENDLVARFGGDEFVLLLPKTSQAEAESLITRIRELFLQANVSTIKANISLGCETKRKSEQDLVEIMTLADTTMFKNKALNRKSANKNSIDEIIDALHMKYPNEKRHSLFVGEFCGRMGNALQLSKLEINQLKLAGYLHDVGKITFDESTMSNEDFSNEEGRKIQEHSAVGYRILNLFDDTLDLADCVYSHHEHWDGQGYPRGLSGKQISVIARIISVVETYERVLNRGDQPLEVRKSQALEVIKSGMGKQFDPEIAKVFIEMIISLEK